MCIYVYTVAGCWGKLEENVDSCGIGVKAIVSLCRCWDSKPGQILVVGIFLVTMYLGSLTFLFSPSSFFSSRFSLDLDTLKHTLQPFPV